MAAFNKPSAVSDATDVHTAMDNPDKTYTQLSASKSKVLGWRGIDVQEAKALGLKGDRGQGTYGYTADHRRETDQWGHELGEGIYLADDMGVAMTYAGRKGGPRDGEDPKQKWVFRIVAQKSFVGKQVGTSDEAGVPTERSWLLR
jgi:hypothetical protein